jgi:pyrroline-5-carboxylate reductase
MNHESKKIAFIGGGMVAEAMIRGLILHGHNPTSIFVADPSEKRRELLAVLNGKLNIETDNNIVAEVCDVLVLALKPQILVSVAEKIAETQTKNDSIVVSVAAGIALDTLKVIFGTKSKLCRAMPNQPCLIGRGISALIASNLNEHEKALASYLFDAVGKSIWIENETWMHTVTAVSGNGPAYFYHMMELLTESAKSAGIPEEIAQELVIQTAIGSTQLALNSSDDFETLRKKVMSPGGTTEAAFDSLEKNNILSIWQEAINAATQRSIELGNQDSDNESE